MKAGRLTGLSIAAIGAMLAASAVAATRDADAGLFVSLFVPAATAAMTIIKRAEMRSLARQNIRPGGFLVTAWMMGLALGTMLHLVLLLRGAGSGVDPGRITLAGSGVVLIAVGNVLPKLRRNRVTGIVNPWTVRDDRVWDRTHRLAAPLMMLAGVVIAFDALFVPGEEVRMTIFGASLCMPALIGTLYSIWLARARAPT